MDSDENSSSSANIKRRSGKRTSYADSDEALSSESEMEEHLQPGKTRKKKRMRSYSDSDEAPSSGSEMEEHLQLAKRKKKKMMRSCSDSDEAPSSDSQIGEKESKKKKRKPRGRAACDDIKLLKEGEQVNVQFNGKGQPIGHASKRFKSYLGILVKSRVLITIESWKKVPEPRKNRLWTAVKAKFNVENMMKIVLGIMGDIWKHFKSRITTKYITPFKDQPRMLKYVPKVYKRWIRQDVWKEFVKNRLTDEFQAKSKAKSEARATKRYNHRLGKKGYSGLEEELREELGATFDPKDRAFKWIRAHQNKSHCYVDEATREVGERIDMYKKKVETGEIVVHGTKDVLTLALGNGEHGSSVRCERKGVTQTNYFNLVKRGSKKHTSQLEALLEEERVKRREEEEEKRKAYERELMLLNEKFKLLQEEKSSHCEKIASNSIKSDSRPHIPPDTLSEEAQSPMKRRKQSHVKTNGKENSHSRTPSKSNKSRFGDEGICKSKSQRNLFGKAPTLGEGKNVNLQLMKLQT